MRRRLIPLLLLFPVAAFAQLPPPVEGPSLERLYSFPLVNGRSPSSPAMSPKGDRIVFGWNQTGERKLDLWLMEFPSGAKKQIVKADSIPEFPRQEDKRTELEKKEAALYDGGISGAVWSPDGEELLFSYRGRTWLVDPDSGNPRPLIDAQEGIFSVRYTPDGKGIAFLKGTNLYVLDRKTGGIKQLTFIASPNTRVDGYEFSPDGQRVAVTWSDDSKTGRHVMMDFSKDKAEVVNIRRMWHGERSVNVKVGVVPASGGVIEWVPGLPTYMWLTDVQWSPDSLLLMANWYKEDFQEWTISVTPYTTMKRADVYVEKAPKNYLADWRPALWARDSKSIVFGTDVLDGKFGFRSVLKIPASGGKPEKVYSEQHDVASLARPKDSDRLILTTMARSGLKSEITILEPNGERKVHVVVPDGMSTPKEFDDAASPLFNHRGDRIATMASSRSMNPELFAVEPEAKRLTVSQRPEFASIKWAETQEVTFKSKDGQTIHGLLITRPGLDKSKKHPAFISNMYANSAKQAWSGYFENYAAMNLDMVVLQVDFRASWGYGGEFNSGYWKSMGVVDTDEAVAAKEFLSNLGYVNPNRVGVWGWSYGGYLTCMIMLTAPGVFDTGVAVASVTDWKNYNEWYTRRRLGMESDDPEVYKKTSPRWHAKGLLGNLFLVHGMLDDNVLYQDTAQLIQGLIEEGKHFDMLAYPRDDHGIGKDTSRPHVFTAVMRYLYEKLGRKS